MHLRLLFAVPDQATEAIMHTVLGAALILTPLQVSSATVYDRAALECRLAAELDDIVFLDWGLVEAATPHLVSRLLSRHPRLRIVALLPENQRQYRCKVWDAGACNGIPKEYMDQEWLSTVLCIMHRAMEREAKLLQRYAQGVTHG